MKLIVIRYIFLHILFAFTLAINAQSFQLKNFSLKDGLPSDHITVLFQDSRNTLWIGTKDIGLCHYNGKDFQVLFDNDGPNLNHISSICEDQKGNILIASKESLWRYNGNKFEQLLADFNIADIEKVANRELWIASDSSLYAYSSDKEKELSVVHQLSGESINKLYRFGQSVYVLTNKSAYKILGQDLRKIDLPAANFTAVCQDSEGFVWLGDDSGNIYHIINDEIIHWNKIFPIKKGRISNLLHSSNNKTFIANEAVGIQIYNHQNRKLTNVSFREGLSSKEISSMIEDDNGSIWMGSRNSGIDRYSEEVIQRFERKDGLSDDRIVGLSASKNELLITNLSNTTDQYSELYFDRLELPVGFQNFPVSVLAKDEKGNFYLGSKTRGLLIFGDSLLQTFNAGNSEIGNEIMDLDIIDNDIWIRSDRRISKLIMNDTLGLEGAFQFQKIDKIFQEASLNLEWDSKGNTWFLKAQNILVKLGPKNKYDQYNLGKSLAGKQAKMIKPIFNGKYICVLFEKSELGIFSPDENKMIDLNIDGLGVPEYEFYDVLEAENKLFLVHSNGLMKISMDENAMVISQEQFGHSDGIYQPSKSQQSMAYFDDHIWLATNKGLIRFKSEAKTKASGSLKVYLTDVKLLFESIYETDYAENVGPWLNQESTIELNPSDNNLGFSFMASNYTSDPTTKFQWFLEGHDSNWNGESLSTEVNYSNLKPGKYRFMVKAITSEAVAFSQPFEFRIQQPIWNSLWLKFTLFLISVGAIWLFIHRRTKKIKLKADEKNEELLLKNKMLDLEQKALQLQMNPHFIFNAMNAIQGAIALDDKKGARKQLRDFSGLMRSTLNHSRKDKIALDEEIDIIRKYLDLESFSRNKSFSYEIKVSENIESDMISIPPMMIQPFVENAIIHGVNHRNDNKGKILVEFELVGNKIRVSVDDNGVGRERAEKLKKSTHRSTGIQVIQERLNILHSKSLLKQIEYIDKYDDESRPIGTTVKILLPILEL